MSKEDKKLIKFGIVMVFFLGAFLLIGNEDAKEEVNQYKFYCEMVESKNWPDYKGIYTKECKK